MAERTIAFSKAGSGDVTGRIYVDRAPPVASWHQEEEGTRLEGIAEAIGSALERKVAIVDVRHEGDGLYSGIVRNLDANPERAEP